VADLMEAAGEGSALHLLRDTTADGLAPIDELLEPVDALPPPALADRLFAHVVVDEAQDLTGMEWLALLWRCPSRSVTAVGDRAQSREPFTESWPERLAGVGLSGARVLRLSINYRTPAILMEPAAAVIHAARPTVDVPEAIRSDGSPLVLERVDEDLIQVAVARAVQLVAAGGTAGVVAHASRHRSETPPSVTFFTPADLQGLEMDAIVIVEPAELWDDTEASAASLYVTLTRATQAVCVLRQRDLPSCALPILAGER
jgi:DNA helicase IV